MSKKCLPLLLCLGIIIIYGCEECTKTPSQPINHFQTPAFIPTQQSNNVVSKTFYCESCPVVRIDAFMPPQVQARKEFEYTLKITNLTNELITNVIVSDVLSSNFQSLRSNPPSAVADGRVKWVFPQIGPGQTVEITGVGMALEAGEVLDFVDVAYNAPVKLRSISLAPKLAITKSAPAEISVCAPILYIFKIENTGNGTANNVRLYDTLPPGLTASDGAATLDLPIGSIAPGQSTTLTVTLRAAQPGTYVNNAVAIADGEVTAESGNITTIVRKPVLAIEANAPKIDYINMELPYTITVTNTGDWPAIKTRIESILPQGLTFVRGSQGASLQDGKVVWNVDRINPGQSAAASLTLMPAVIGSVENTFRASADCADVVSAIAKTEIKGAPGILLELSDVSDPIRVGNNTTYRIMATNQGPVPVTNIAITATLDDSMNLVSSKGATQGQVSENGVIAFAPLGFLAPKTQAIWEVTVKAAVEGDARFKVEMTSDQLVTPVMETESTHFFE